MTSLGATTGMAANAHATNRLITSRTPFVPLGKDGGWEQREVGGSAPRAARSRPSDQLRRNRQGEREARAAAIVRLRPEMAAVRLDDRPADREAPPHAVGLG